MSGSQRLTNSEATDAHVGRTGPPRAGARCPACTPRRPRGYWARREQQRDVDRDAREDRRLDRGQALGRARDLDVQVRAVAERVEPLRLGGRRRRVVGDQRRDLERDEAVDAVRALERRPEQVRGAAQVVDRELEERVLARLARPGRASAIWSSYVSLTRRSPCRRSSGSRSGRSRPARRCSAGACRCRAAGG